MPLGDPGNVARGHNCLLFTDIKDSDGISLDLEEDSKVGVGSQDVDARYIFERVRVFAHRLIAIPVSQLVEPGMDPLPAIVVKGSQGNVYRRGCDNCFHGLSPRPEFVGQPADTVSDYITRKHRHYPFFGSQPRWSSTSAIWMALLAAPLRRLSATNQIFRPCGTVGSRRMRPTKTASRPSACRASGTSPLA